MESLRVLEEFGLAKQEALVYLALLQHGSAPVLAIARATGLKRPTIYLILDELIRKGFVTIVPGEKKKLFLALPPERFEEELERRQRIVRAAIPELSAAYRAQTGRPSVRFFESREGILGVYREIASESELREILSFVSLDSIPKEFSEIYDIFFRLYDKKGISGREIISTNDPGHPYVEKLKKFPNYQFRFTHQKHRFLTDSVIYGNKIATFSFKKRFALVTESEDVVGSWRSLFELAWQSARQVKA